MSTENTPPPARNKHKSINAVALYNKLIELLTLVPDTKDWQEETLKGEPAKYYRLLQLKGMVKAFHIDSIDDLMSGNFIELNKTADYKKIITKITAHKLMGDYSLLNRWGLKKYIHSNMFSDKKNMLLSHYQVTMQRLLEHVFVDGKGGEQKLRKDYDAIAHCKKELSEFVSPNRRKMRIEVGTLIENFDCPDVNVFALDDEETKNIFENNKPYQPMQFTASAIMTTYFNLLELEPHTNLWKEDVLYHDSEKYELLLRFKSLLKAFEIESIDEFLSGSFLHKRDMRRYIPYYAVVLSAEKSTKFKRHVTANGESIVEHPEKMLELFTRHFRFCTELHDLVKKETKTEETERFYRYSLGDMADIINPEGEHISRHRLIKEYGYPG
jgi:hypothetical protein